MAFFDTTWYVNFGNGSSTGYYAVAKRPQNAAVAAGQLVRQFTAPAVGSERCYICTVAGTTANTTDATWNLNRGINVVDGTVTWRECTGSSAMNGDATNTPTWSQIKALGGITTAGVIIKRNNGASYHMANGGGVGASEPAFSDVAGSTVIDNATIWTCLGPVGNFSGGGAPHARLATVVSTIWLVTSTVFYTIYVGDNHAETQATAINITFTSATVPVRVLCHNHLGAYPPASGDLTTGATITTSGNTQITLQIGPFYIYGLTFIGSATGATATFYIILKATNTLAGQLLYFDNCSFQIANAVANASIFIGDSTIQQPTWIVWNNCTVKFGATQNLQLCNCRFQWKNTGQVLVSGSTVPTNLFVTPSQSGVIDATLEALDLSQISSSLWTGSISVSMGNLLIKDCKLHASVTVTTPAGPGMIVQLVRSDSGVTAYKSARYLNEGTETTETAITRVGGAVDPTGQAQSRKVVTSANAHSLRPFYAEPYAVWNAVTGANVTVTVYGTINAGAVPNNDEIWLELEYLGSSLTPLGTIVNTTKANVLAAAAAVASDSSTWNNAVQLNTTLNSADKDTHITLSGGNLTALGTVGWTGLVRAVDGKSAGKFYFECTFNAAAAQSGVGVSISSLPVATTTFSGSVVAGHSGLTSSGTVWVEGSSFLTIDSTPSSVISFGTIASGTVICVAIDLAAKKIWFRLGAGGNWNNLAGRDPATGVGGAIITNVTTAYPTLCFGGADTLIANFGSSAFTGAVPSGFTAGWPTATSWLPFKLAATLSSPQPGLAGYIHARVRAAKVSTTYYIDPQIMLS